MRDEKRIDEMTALKEGLFSCFFQDVEKVDSNGGGNSIYNKDKRFAHIFSEPLKKSGISDFQGVEKHGIKRTEMNFYNGLVKMIRRK
ncbi:MAG: hypothetical protein J6D18_03490 [Erysipelotrichaceae bacterium]|nr:hypothetical protein [Erysipelotrichaceae bacterium]